MHFPILLITLLFTVLSVDALSIALDKRATTASPQLCAGDINDVGTQLGQLQAAVTAGGMLNIHHDYSSLSDKLDTAQDSCCALSTNNLNSSNTTTVDANIVLQSLAVVTPKVQNALSEIQKREGDYSFFTKYFVKSYLKNLDKKTDHLHSCFNAFIPPDNSTVLQGYFNDIEAAFNAAKSAYGI